MSYHATNPELERVLEAQKRNATITSVIIALLVAALLGVIMAFILIATVTKSTPEIITFQAPSSTNEVVDRPEITNQVERKPSSPSSSMASVIVSNAASPVSVPKVDVDTPEPSLDFGDGDDFGAGWGSGGSGTGAAGGGGATFFEQSVKAEKICFVIDYSQSMTGRRIQLLKEELKKSVENLPESVQYQLIFFAGPAWVAGDRVEMAKDRKSAVVLHQDSELDWKSSGGAHNWDTKGRKMRPQWKPATKDNIQRSLSAIQSTPLVWGTAWEAPIEMALDMNPAPDVVFFMTDGSAGPDSEKIAKRMGHRAKRRGVVVNTIALMEPQVKGAMATLAQETGGAFSLVDQNGKSTVIVKPKEK
ncbi:hypothetical protein Rhal01_01405 [Rubritalea halochordaticola]|uniref:VWFA domain-containing protein n=2 Tax=Rubritalea halochordaticola TaxID=714537 RepID=A0ABP9UZS0_9BACT